MLGARFNYLHNQGPTDCTLLPSHFSHSVCVPLGHTHCTQVKYICQSMAWCFNSWVSAAPTAVCNSECLLWYWRWHFLWYSGDLSWAWADGPWSTLVSARKPKSYIQAVRSYVCNKILFPLWPPCLCFILIRDVIWTVGLYFHVSCSVLR